MKILSTPVDVSACGHYRVRQPLHGLEKYCGDVIHIYDEKKDNVQDLIKSLPYFDYIIMRPGAELFMTRVKNIPEFANLKAKWILDIDDNVDLISPYSQFYANYGTKEVYHEGRPLWVNGKAGFDTMKNIKTLTSLKVGMRSADMVFVTTEKLANHALKYNKNIYINDNSIDFNNWWRLNNTESKTLRVVWQGSPSHYEDWLSIREPLNKLMREYNLEIIMLGSQYGGIFDEDNKRRVKAMPWVPFEAHSYRMMSLQADLGIIPLADNGFNQYKSAIKWYENAAAGIPSIVSNISPYKDVIQDNVTAIGYKTPKEFYAGMKKLILDHELRENIAESAYKWVKSEKSLEVESKKLHNYLSERLDALTKQIKSD